MAIDLGEMRSFIAVCEQRHFGRAAELLHISQPALSKQVLRLEQRLGGALLIRRSGGLHLTSAGELFLQQARSLVADMDAAERVTRLALHGEAGILREGSGVAVLARGLPDVILRFRRQYPEVSLSVKNMSTTDQVQALGDRSIDLGFIRLPVNSNHIEALPLITERLMIVLGNSIKTSPTAWVHGARHPSSCPVEQIQRVFMIMCFAPAMQLASCRVLFKKLTCSSPL